MLYRTFRSRLERLLTLTACIVTMGKFASSARSANASYMTLSEVM